MEGEKKRKRARARALSLSLVIVSIRDGKASQERGARKKRKKWAAYAQEHLLLASPLKTRPLLM